MEKLVRVIWNICKSILYWSITKVLRIKLSDERWNDLLQFLRFGLVGLSNSALSYILFLISLWLFQKFDIWPQVDYLIAQLIGFMISVLWSFYWNRKFVFHAENLPWPRALLKTYLSYAFSGIVLNSVLSIIWVQGLGIPKVVAPILNLVVSVPVNFLLNKFWAFRKPKASDEN